jgi:fluoroacetyl-CoA thioesterase
MNSRELPLTPGSETSLEQIVETKHLASAYAIAADESYPNVLATPAMVALAERTCARLLEPLLEPGRMSVGAVVRITHSAPTALHEKVRASATFNRKDGPLYWFDVVVTDAAGVVGEGQHARAIVNEEMVRSKSEARRAPPSTTE